MKKLLDKLNIVNSTISILRFVIGFIVAMASFNWATILDFFKDYFRGY